MLTSLIYATHAYELADSIPTGLHHWQPADWQAALQARLATEKARQELQVNYYRIGHTLAFPLPLGHRPTNLPPGIPGWTGYPWYIWLVWALEERWRVLHTGWRQLRDDEAGALFQTELAALAGWGSFVEQFGQVHLVTGHMAAMLALGLNNPTGWEEAKYQQATTAATLLLDQDVRPWFQQVWADKEQLTPSQLHNIPVIVLTRSAQLARVLNHELADTLEAKARAALQAWRRYRVEAPPHTEGTSYDGYLMDSATEWLAGLPDRATVLAQTEAAWASLIRQWVQLTLPGRPDLHAPLGDVEPEMPFWMNVLVRLAHWRRDPMALWLVQQLPPPCLPAAALSALVAGAAIESTVAPALVPPTPAPTEVANAVTLRTGWDSADLAVTVGLSRSQMSHLHNDNGQVIIGWQNRFWITDPGYQQYRPGLERDYTIGLQAHNTPVIGGTHQTKRAARLLTLETTAQGWQHTAIALTGCYANLPAAAHVQRDVWLVTPPAEAPGSHVVLVRDQVTGLPADLSIETHWQGGAALAWSFHDNWARWSDGAHTLWLSLQPGTLDPAGLALHAGSRGALTLSHTREIREAVSDNQPLTWWWFFCCEPHLSWTPPQQLMAQLLSIQ